MAVCARVVLALVFHRRMSGSLGTCCAESPARPGPELSPHPHDANPAVASGIVLWCAQRARVAEWQTRRSQKPLRETSCGFDPHLGHQLLSVLLGGEQRRVVSVETHVLQIGRCAVRNAAVLFHLREHAKRGFLPPPERRPRGSCLVRQRLFTTQAWVALVSRRLCVIGSFFCSRRQAPQREEGVER